MKLVQAVKLEEISQYEGHDVKTFLAEVVSETQEFLFFNVPSKGWEFRLSKDGSAFEIQGRPGSWSTVTSLKVVG